MIIPSTMVEDRVDPDPVTWEQGARYSFAGHQPRGDGPFLVAKLTSPVRAFGVRLYRSHGHTCAGAQSRARERARQS